MTIGNRVADYRYADAYGRKTLGLYKSRVWSGSDWSASVAAAARRRQLKEDRPDPWYYYKATHSSFLFEVKDEKEIVRRHHVLYGEWKGKLELWKNQLKAYHEWKASWKARDTEFHPYEASILQSFTTPAYISVKGGTKSKVPESPVSALGYPAVPSLFWTADDENATIEKFREKLTNMDKGFHAGVAVAELEKTLKMIRDNAQVLRRFGQRMHKGDIPGALRVLYNGKTSAFISGFAGLSRGAQQYLAYQFGLKPLVEDMDGAGQFIGYTQFQSKTRRVRVTRKREQDFGNTGVFTRPGKKTIGLRIVAYLKSVPSALDLSGLLDVPAMLWERLMFSFVIDWWFKIGLALQAMQMARLLTGTFVKTRYEKTVMGAYASGSSYIVEQDASTMTSVYVKRTIETKLNVQVPKLRPTFHPVTEVRLRHATEAIALLVVNKKRISKGVEWLKSKNTKPWHNDASSHIQW